jgi:hypothetical protein
VDQQLGSTCRARSRHRGGLLRTDTVWKSLDGCAEGCRGGCRWSS